MGGKSKMKSIAIIAANGMLGYAVSLYFESKHIEVKKITRKEFDIVDNDFQKLENLVKDVDCIINCAGIIKPLISSNRIEDILNVNSIFPRNLSILSKLLNVKVIHVTTDCVFSGKKGNYNENSYFDAEDLYGLSKCAGDIGELMTLRTSIIGEEKNNSRSLLAWAKSQAGKQINGYINHFWNGLTTVYFAEIIYKILTSGHYKKGIFHIYSPNKVSKFELLNYINEIYTLDLKIVPIEASEYCDRTLSSIYSLSKELVQIPIYDQIKSMREFFKNENCCSNNVIQ